MNKRFTIDGSEALEQRLQSICAAVVAAMLASVPSRKVEAVVLGGGYGRGEGGVLRTNRGDEPYNDMEFYIFMRGSRSWNQRRYSSVLAQLEEELTDSNGIHIEFKIDSISRLRRSSVSMFTYDLVAGHRVVHGAETVFRDCGHHLRAKEIPLGEGTRLLFNRASGLLLARQMLTSETFGDAEKDFVTRNIAKARMALGDAVLVAKGEYHWSALERQRRLKPVVVEDAPWLEQIREYHREGVRFKLWPYQSTECRKALTENHTEVTACAQHVWLWLESRRLRVPYRSSVEYALDGRSKCPEQLQLRNVLLNLNSFGLPAILGPRLVRYPRERLMNCLPLLLWSDRASAEFSGSAQVRRELQCSEKSWGALVNAYQRIWPRYG